MSKTKKPAAKSASRAVEGKAGPAAGKPVSPSPSPKAGVSKAGPRGAPPPRPVAGGKAKPSATPATRPQAGSGKGAAAGKAPIEAPAGPRWPKGGPSKADLKRYRERLLEMRRALLSSSQELAAEALKSSGQEFSVDHMADHGSDNYEQDFSLKLLEGETEQLTEIREALMKIDGKVDVPFGLCEACADDAQGLCETCPWIPPSRLDVLPHARLCVQTKEIEEKRPG